MNFMSASALKSQPRKKGQKNLENEDQVKEFYKQIIPLPEEEKPKNVKQNFFKGTKTDLSIKVVGIFAVFQIHWMAANQITKQFSSNFFHILISQRQKCLI